MSEISLALPRVGSAQPPAPSFLETPISSAKNHDFSMKLAA